VQPSRLQRREFIAGLGGAAVVLPLAARAQQGDRVRRIGMPLSNENDPQTNSLVNLILNAVEAISSVEAGPRELSISTAQDQTGVLVAVGDSGPGIDPKNLDPNPVPANAEYFRTSLIAFEPVSGLEHGDWKSATRDWCWILVECRPKPRSAQRRRPSSTSTMSPRSHM
jgi:hypothetical protein